MRVTVLGANSFIGQHFVRYLQTTQAEAELTTWSFEGQLENRIGGISTAVPHFEGPTQLKYALHDADVVVNLHEHQDLSVLPDIDLLTRHNLEVVRSILFLLGDEKSRSRLVHLSSIYLQCSDYWPNINEQEVPANKYHKQWPFPEYCRSKCDAEELIMSSGIDHYIVRPVLVYGSGDDCSLLTDLIRTSEWFGCVPVIGGRDGIMQMASVENITAAIWSSATHLVSRTSVPEEVASLMDQATLASPPPTWSIVEECEQHSKVLGIVDDVRYPSLTCLDESSLLPIEVTSPVHEVIILSDHTPLSSVYTSVGDLTTSGKREMSSYGVPFHLVYYPYLLFFYLISLLSLVISIPAVIGQLPHPNVLYMYFYQFTTFNTMKCRFLLKFHPPHTVENSLTMSLPHYRRLGAKDISHFSWKPRVR